MRPLVIYHAGCRDGFCAAWVAHGKFTGEKLKEHDVADFHAAQYGTEPPPVAGRDVFVLDFSYPRDVMDRMNAEAESLLVLDHHKTAEEALAGAEYAQFDMNRSGAGMSWDHFNPGAARPMLVDYVEDRDLWRHRLPHSREVNAYVSTLPYDFAAWQAAETTAMQDLWEAGDRTITARKHGAIIVASVDTYAQVVGNNARLVSFDGYMVPVVNAPQINISELLSHLCEKHSTAPFAVGWWQRNDGVFQYSLRSRGDFDVSMLAKSHGGGGHKSAAGFQSPMMLG